MPSHRWLRKHGCVSSGFWFKPGRRDDTPIYTLGFDLYENGVSRALRLDYGDFSLKGEMTRLELLPGKGCQR